MVDHIENTWFILTKRVIAVAKIYPKHNIKPWPGNLQTNEGCPQMTSNYLKSGSTSNECVSVP